jgi:hypothetical protein
VLRRHGQHELALNIYVHKLKNDQMAEKYVINALVYVSTSYTYEVVAVTA